MALGGGTFIVQNKILGGAYFQFLSAQKSTATIGDRGVGALALDLNWGVENNIFTVEATDFIRDSMDIFGYDYSADEMQSIREIFAHAQTVHFYRLNGNGEKASNAFATAKYSGTRGNDLKIVIAKNVDDDTQFDVSVYVGTTIVSTQTAKSADQLVDTDFVIWKDDAELTVTAGEPLTGGTNGTSDTTSHQAFLNKLEAFPDTNAVGYFGDEETVKGLYCNWAKRMRDEIGIYLQAVVYNKAFDNISVVNVKNSVDLVPWVTGVIAGTAVNKSCTNMVYDGELTVNTDYTQKQLENAIKAGEFVLHRVGDDVRVLEDINSFISITDEYGEVFCDNQTIRIIDEIATSIAKVFCTKYLGKVPNDVNGRISLWSDVCSICRQLADIRALENFDSDDVKVEQGDTKKSVLINAGVTVVNTMVKLYMKTIIA
jgi:hypothetical protein